MSDAQDPWDVLGIPALEWRATLGPQPLEYMLANFIEVHNGKRKVCYFAPPVRANVMDCDNTFIYSRSECFDVYGTSDLNAFGTWLCRPDRMRCQRAELWQVMAYGTASQRVRGKSITCLTAAHPRQFVAPWLVPLAPEDLVQPARRGWLPESAPAAWPAKAVQTGPGAPEPPVPLPR